MKQSKNWRAYVRTSFNSLRANRDNWGDSDYFRPISRLFYIAVFDCAQVNHTGMISEEALKNPKERTHDHCNRPQFIARMIMDRPDIYLEDYVLYENLFWIACTTNTVTKSENKQLSLLTNHKNGEYKVFVTSDLTYKHLGINLFQRKKGNQWKMSNCIPCDNLILTPPDVLEHEKLFLK